MKFVVVSTEVTPERPHGLSYSLTLRAPDGARLVGAPGERSAGSGDAETRGKRPQAPAADNPALRLPGYRHAARGFLERGGRGSKGKGIDLMKTLKIGIAGYNRMNARTLAITRGEHKPGEGEPIVWFTSVQSFAKVLSERNRELLAMIAREKPDSLTKLATLAGRNKSNLSRTLKTMSRYGLVELEEGQRGTLIPRVPYDQVQLDVSLTSTQREVRQEWILR